MLPAQAAEAVVETALMIDGTPEPDGRPVPLDVTILTTDPATPRPAIVLAHGFNGTKDDSLEPARTLAEDGYAVIIYTARGFGASGGSDPSRSSRLRGRRRGQDHRPGGVATRGGPRPETTR